MTTQTKFKVGDRVILYYGATATIVAKHGRKYTFATSQGEVTGYIGHILGHAAPVNPYPEMTDCFGNAINSDESIEL